MQFVKGQVEMWTPYIKFKKRFIWQNHSCEKCVSKWDGVNRLLRRQSCHECFTHSGWKFLPLLITPLLEKNIKCKFFSNKGVSLNMERCAWFNHGVERETCVLMNLRCHKTFKLKQQLPLSNFTPDLSLAHTKPVVPYSQCSAWRGNQELKSFCFWKQRVIGTSMCCKQSELVETAIIMKH